MKRSCHHICKDAGGAFLETDIKPRRIHFLDEVRGFDLILMVAFHAFYVFGWLYDLEWGRKAFLFFTPVEPFFAGLFILLCGISCYLSHSNLRRGLILAGIAAGISVVMYLFMPSEMIWFGILHFLAVAILLFVALKPLLSKIPSWIGLPVCAVLLILTWHLPAEMGGYFGIPGVFQWQVPESIASQWWLYPLGLGRGTGSDYFPVFPHIFTFLGGTFLGVWARDEKFPQWMYKSRAPWLSWLGKHTLIVYVAHQPIVFAVTWVVFWIMGLF